MIFCQLREPAKLIREENAAGNAKTQHERVLRRSYVKQAVVLEPETIVFGRWRIVIAVMEDAVPDCERVVLVLTALLAREIGDRSIKPCGLCLRLIGKARGGVSSDEAVGGVAHEIKLFVPVAITRENIDERL